MGLGRALSLGRAVGEGPPRFIQNSREESVCFFHRETSNAVRCGTPSSRQLFPVRVLCPASGITKSQRHSWSALPEG